MSRTSGSGFGSIPARSVTRVGIVTAFSLPLSNPLQIRS